MSLQNKLKLKKCNLDFQRSFSQIDMYKNCGRLYYYRYGLGNWGEKGEAFLFGELLHKKLSEKLLTNKSFIEDDELLWAENYELLRQQITIFVNKAMKKLKELGLNSKKVNPDNVEFKLESGNFQGRIDFLGYKLEDDSPIIIDWKTTSWEYKDYQVASSFQLMGYTWLFWKNKNIIPESAFITFNKKNNKVEHYLTKFTEEDLLEFEHFLDWAESSITNGYFPKNEKSCFLYGKTCEFYEQCWKRQVENSKVSISEL